MTQRKEGIIGPRSGGIVYGSKAELDERMSGDTAYRYDFYEVMRALLTA